jgi:hypothetical protein
MRILAIALVLTLFPPGLAQKPTPQVLLAGRCHKSGDAVLKVRLQCNDTSGSLFCGVVSSTLRSLPKTEMAYSDADSDAFLRVYKAGNGAGFYLGQPYVFPNGHSTGATHYLKEASINFGADDPDSGSKLVHDGIAPSLEPIRAEIEKEVTQRAESCPALTDEEDHAQ